MSNQQRELPRGWIRTTLGEIAQPYRQTVDPQSYPELPYIGLEQVEAHTMRLLGTVPAATMQSAATRFSSGDVLYGRLRPNLNKVYSPDFGGLCSNEFLVFPASKYLESRYLQYLLNSKEFVTFATRLISGERPRVDYEQLASFPVALPPLADQRRIVDELEGQFGRLANTDATIDRIEASVQHLRIQVLSAACEGRLVPTEAELARAAGHDYQPAGDLLRDILDVRRERWEESYFKQLVAQGKKPRTDRWKSRYKAPAEPDTESLPGLPEGWVWTTVEQVGEVTPGRKRMPKYEGGPHMRPYLRVANVFEDRIDTSDILRMNFSPQEYKVYRLEAGDIILNEGQSIELVGRPAMYRNEVPGACFQNTLIRFRAYSGLSASFALLVFRHYLHSKRFQRLAKRSTNIAHLGADRFTKLEFPLPPLAEQERILNEADRCFSIADRLTEVIATTRRRLELLRETVTRRAFDGELVEPEGHGMPASEILPAIAEERQERARRRQASDASRRAHRRRPMGERKSLHGILSGTKRKMKPEELLRASGIDEELIDEFFEELKREVLRGRIMEERNSNRRDVYLYAKAGRA